MKNIRISEDSEPTKCVSMETICEHVANVLPRGARKDKARIRQELNDYIDYCEKDGFTIVDNSEPQESYVALVEDLLTNKD
jgi:hypothetical protein